MERITNNDLRIGYLLAPEYLSLKRPRTRSECPEFRPCPFIGCRYNLYLDVDGRLGVKDAARPWDMPAHGSCALDIAEEGEKTLEEIAAILGVTRERVRQIEESAMAKVSERIPFVHVRSLLKGKDNDDVF